MLIPGHHLNDFNILLILSFLSSKTFLVQRSSPGPSKTFKAPYYLSSFILIGTFSPYLILQPTQHSRHPDHSFVPGFSWISVYLDLYTSFQAHLYGLLPEAVPKIPSCLCPIQISPLFWAIPISLCKVRSSWNLRIYLSVVWALCWPELTSVQSLANADTRDL